MQFWNTIVAFFQESGIAGFFVNGGWKNIIMIVVIATLGALIGAVINYVLSLIIGRPVVYAFANSRIGHMCLIDAEKVEKAEAYFDRHGAISTFLGRLIPAIRQLISIPAGLSRMNFGTFSFYTVLGAGLWNVVLALLGYLLYRIVPDDSQLFAQLEHYSHYLKIAGFILLGCAVAYIGYRVYKNKKNKSIEKSQGSDEKSDA